MKSATGSVIIFFFILIEYQAIFIDINLDSKIRTPFY